MNLIIDWLRSLASKDTVEVHVKVKKDTETNYQKEETNTKQSEYTYKNETFSKEVETMTLTEKYWLTLLFVFLRYLSILMFGSGIGFIIAGLLVSPWWYLGLASWPLFIMVGVVNMVYICALSKHNKLQFRYVVNNY